MWTRIWDTAIWWDVKLWWYVVTGRVYNHHNLILDLTGNGICIHNNSTNLVFTLCFLFGAQMTLDNLVYSRSFSSSSVRESQHFQRLSLKCPYNQRQPQPQRNWDHFRKLILLQFIWQWPKWNRNGNLIP